MSEQNAGTERLKRYTLAAREVLKRVAPGGKESEEATNGALSNGLKPAGKAIATGVEEARGAVSKKLGARARRASHRLPGASRLRFGHRSKSSRRSALVTSPRSWWTRARSLSKSMRGSGRMGGKGRRMNPAITLLSAVITALVAAITFGLTKGGIRRVVTGHGSKPHGLANSVPSAHDLIERALKTEKSDERTARHHGRWVRSQSRHPAHRR
jgi:hypothetical protein